MIHRSEQTNIFFPVKRFERSSSSNAKRSKQNRSVKEVLNSRLERFANREESLPGQI